MRLPAQLLDFRLQGFASVDLTIKVLFDTRERKRETIRLRLHGNLSQVSGGWGAHHLMCDFLLSRTVLKASSRISAAILRVPAHRHDDVPATALLLHATSSRSA